MASGASLECADMTSLTLVGGPTALIEYAGRRFLTDPTFSEPGAYDGLDKTTGPAIPAADLGSIDVVLLSHDHHADNLDPAGRALLPACGRVLTTVAGAARLGGTAEGLAPWDTTTITAPDGTSVTITAVPAVHGPPVPDTETISGPVIGFVLASPGNDTVYVSGDNASLDVVRDVKQRVGHIDAAVLFVGAVQIMDFLDGGYLTLTGDLAAVATTVLGARVVVPVHFEGWTHFTQGLEQLRLSFRGLALSDRLLVAERGQTVRF
jgi:L-ascorbate metabolism protein UlaG (beta-lactamase superfamily)